MTEQSFGAALDKLWPRAPSKKRNAIKEVAPKLFERYGMADPLVICHFMAQVSHENGAGTITRESGNYSAARLVEIFGSPHSSAGVTASEAQQLQHNGPAIFERVYNLPKSPKLAKMLGNHEPGDGYKFRGNGDLQLTGRASHERIGKLTGFDLANHPEMLEDPAISFEVACAEFKALGCIPLAKADKGQAVGVRVNGGTNGAAERAVWLRKWKEAMPTVEEPAWAPRAAETDEKVGLLSTRTGQLGTATGIASAVATGSQVINSVTTTTDTIQTVTDNVTSAKGAADQVVVVYQSVKPFLGILPDTWRMIAICAGAIALCAVVGVLFYRHKKLAETGL